jgi:hypothetical protein
LVGFAGGPGNVASPAAPRLENIPLFTANSSQYRIDRISTGTPAALREIITDAPMLDLERGRMRKPAFMFGDAVGNPRHLELGASRWLRAVNGRKIFTPPMVRDMALSELQAVAVPRKMEWDLTPFCDSAACGYIGGLSGVGIDRDGRGVTCLQPNTTSKEIPANESATQAGTFRNRFFDVRGQFPGKNFRTFGWTHSTASGWWTQATEFILDEYADFLRKCDLYVPIRATKFGIKTNAHSFYGVLELYNPDSCTFFTPHGELGLALHEMHEVSGLSMGEVPYEEYVPRHQELKLLEQTHPAIVETYWEVICHYHICMQVFGSVDKKGVKKRSSPSISHKLWADYLFKNLESRRGRVAPLDHLPHEAVEARSFAAGQIDYTADSDECGFKAGDKFESFHLQAEQPISDKALLAGYLLIWLQKCVVPSRNFETLSIEAIFPAVRLAYGHPYALLPAMVACLQGGLRRLVNQFCATICRDDAEGSSCGGAWSPNPKVELPYSYLMAWFVKHCPCIIGPPAAIREGSVVPFIQRLEGSSWKLRDLADIRKALNQHSNYEFFRCFPYFAESGFGLSFEDASDGKNYSVLALGCFRWLLNIRPGYLIYRSGAICRMEPYMPCRFARQFGYDQCYIGNPNDRLSYEGSLIDGARGWYWYIAGCTGAKFSLPSREPALRMSLAYCKWHRAANTFSTGYNFSTSGLAGIKGWKAAGKKGAQEDDEVFSEPQDEEYTGGYEHMEDRGQDQAGGSSIGQPQIPMPSTAVAEPQAEVREADTQLKTGSDLPADTPVTEPPIDKPAGEAHAELEENLGTAEPPGGKPAEPTTVTGAEAEPEELVRAGEALERVRDLLAGHLRMPQFASPGLKITVRRPKRPGVELIEDSSKRAKVDSSQIQNLSSPPPPAESVPAEGMCPVLNLL